MSNFHLYPDHICIRKKSCMLLGRFMPLLMNYTM